MKDILDSLSNLYDNYIIRDGTKIITGCMVIITWIIYYNLREGTVCWSQLLIIISNLPAVLLVAMLFLGYLLGTLLQEISSITNIMPLEPNISNIREDIKRYSSSLFEIKERYPEAIGILERIIVSKHLASSVAIILFNIAIAMIIAWLTSVITISIENVIYLFLSTIGIVFSVILFYRKKNEQEELIEFLLLK